MSDDSKYNVDNELAKRIQSLSDGFNNLIISLSTAVFTLSFSTFQLFKEPRAMIDNLLYSWCFLFLSITSMLVYYIVRIIVTPKISKFREERNRKVINYIIIIPKIVRISASIFFWLGLLFLLLFGQSNLNKSVSDKQTRINTNLGIDYNKIISDKSIKNIKIIIESDGKTTVELNKE